MDVRRARNLIALAAALAVAVGAIYGSASALLKIATDAHMDPPWSLPVCLDAVAIVAAMAVHRRRTDLLAWATLVGATSISAALQWMAAPDGALNHLAHTVLPVAAVISFELVQRVTDDAAAPKRRRRTQPPVAAKNAAAGRVPARPALTAVVTDEALLVLARQIAEEHGIPATALGRDRLRAGLKKRGHPVGTDRAVRLLALLKESA